MRILFIIPLPPPVHGSSMMSMYIKNSSLINNDSKCDYINLSTSRSMDEIQKFSVRKIFRFLYSYIKTLVLLFTRRYDTCYLATSCFGIPFLKDAPFVMMCKMFCRNVIIHFHNKGMKEYSSRPFYRWMYDKVYKNTTVILLSELLYDDVCRIIKKKQVRICPNGIPDDSEHKKYEKDNDVPNILFLSNLIESKGIICLLDACERMKRKGVDFVCNLVGGETVEISNKRINKEICDRNLDNTVFYKGRAYGADKECYLNKADVFVFPTYYPQECFPVVLLEAMQHHLPCISSYEGAIPEIIKDGYNGLLCDPHNVALLADNLERLILDKKLRSNMGENGYILYEEKYKLADFERNLNIIIKNNGKNRSFNNNTSI